MIFNGTLKKGARAVIYKLLYEEEVDSVRAMFAGSADSGQIEDFIALSVDAEDVTEEISLNTPLDNEKTALIFTEVKTREGINPTLLDTVEFLFYEELESLHGGWEIDAGSSGDIVLKIEKTPQGLLKDAKDIEVDIEIEWGYEDDDDEY